MSAAAQQAEPNSVPIQQAYDRYAPTYDQLDGGGVATAIGFDGLRAQLVSQARGSVLEVAVGTGLNLPYYQWGPQGVTSHTGVDISQGMLDQARSRITQDPRLSDQPITLQQGNVLDLDLPPASFDCVLDTFSLCVLPDPLQALKQMARVVKPRSQGGRVLLLEHARSDNTLLGAYQDFTASAVAATAKGCVWNQDVPRLLAEAGLTVTQITRHTAGTLVMVEAVVDA